jgi:hypothetical protein
MFRSAYAHLLNQLGEMPAFLQRSLDGVPQELLTRLPANDKSPLIEHLWHVRDCDSDLYALRIRRVLREDQPFLDPVDVGAWPEERGYLQRSAAQAVTELAALRSALIAELEGVDDEALARTGQRFDGHRISVLGLIEQLAEHDRDHRWRIAAILGAFAAVPLSRAA